MNRIYLLESFLQLSWFQLSNKITIYNQLSILATNNLKTKYVDAILQPRIVEMNNKFAVEFATHEIAIPKLTIKGIDSKLVKPDDYIDDKEVNNTIDNNKKIDV